MGGYKTKTGRCQHAHCNRPRACGGIPGRRNTQPLLLGGPGSQDHLQGENCCYFISNTHSRFPDSLPGTTHHPNYLHQLNHSLMQGLEEAAGACSNTVSCLGAPAVLAMVSSAVLRVQACART